MDRPNKKIIQYAVAAATALAALAGGLLAGPLAATADDGGHGDARVFTGWGFDTCHAPSLDTLEAWQESPYRAVGVYIGGRARACPDQPHLDEEWVRAADDMGWGVLPIYVGSQSPCVIAEHKKNAVMGGRPWDEGTEEGRDAVERARELGLAPDSPLYLDMEAYDHRNADCADTTLTFVRAWNAEVRRHGYLPGFYSSSGSGVQHMAQARQQGAEDLPEVMWFARWDTEPDVYGESVLPGDAWHPHRRIHQYAGNVTESHGGRSITIDRNRVDAPVAVVADP
ncbi:DUF1906 domain-containing protein [Streptomyces sp. URMC 123]|uniref:DUF1906 domain-containing protein n=1 Tax=Streptomyces sp. URMC 123 TaxID=3423403 RepID=UPI003F194846